MWSAYPELQNEYMVDGHIYFNAGTDGSDLTITEENVLSLEPGITSAA